MNAFDRMMARYNPLTDHDLVNARHEVMQQVTLAGLHLLPDPDPLQA